MQLTWLGHSAFRLEFGKTVLLIDPFLKGNPTFEAAKLDFAKVTAGTTHVAVTHGHDDHIGSSVEICQATNATLISNFEICMYLTGQGVKNISPGNHGGELDFGEFSVAFVNAWHSSAATVDGQLRYMGNPAGYVVRTKAGRSLLHMGDTGIHSDMALTQELYAPEVGIVPIGDRFTMGARQAALACRKFFKFRTIVPCHFGTFPGMLDATADKFVTEAAGMKVVVPRIGEAFEV
jgi:L-ascorbate metabolism protein UlaG (beta-lactamase superfamily)